MTSRAAQFSAIKAGIDTGDRKGIARNANARHRLARIMPDTFPKRSGQRWGKYARPAASVPMGPDRQDPRWASRMRRNRWPMRRRAHPRRSYREPLRISAVTAAADVTRFTDCPNADTICPLTSLQYPRNIHRLVRIGKAANWTCRLASVNNSLREWGVLTSYQPLLPVRELSDRDGSKSAADSGGKAPLSSRRQPTVSPVPAIRDALG